MSISIRVILFIPIYGPSKAVFQGYFRQEPKFLSSACYIELPSRLSIGPTLLPADLSLVTGKVRNRLDQLIDKNLAAVTEVKRKTLIVFLSCQQYAFCAIFNVQKLPRYSARPPRLNKRL